MIYTLSRTKIYYAKTQNILKNLNMVVFVYYHFKSNTCRRKLYKYDFKKLFLHLMFRSAILHNSSSVHPCSVAPLLEITKYINMHDYKYIRGYCGYICT